MSVEDKDILLKALSQNPQWGEVLNWNKDIDVQYWQGVEADDSGTVTGIFLTGFALKGNIPSALSELKSLQTLLLDHNQFDAGPIPMVFTKSQNLANIFLQGNNFVGPCPEHVKSVNLMLDPGNAVDPAREKTMKKNKAGDPCWAGISGKNSFPLGSPANKLHYCMKMKPSPFSSKQLARCGPVGVPCGDCIDLYGIKYDACVGELSGGEDLKKELNDRISIKSSTVSSSNPVTNLISCSLEDSWRSDGSGPSESSPHWVEMKAKNDLPLGSLKVYLKDHGSYSPEKVRIKKRTSPDGAWITIGDHTLPKKEEWFDLVSLDEGMDALEYRFEVHKNHEGGCDCRVIAFGGFSSIGVKGTTDKGRKLIASWGTVKPEKKKEPKEKKGAIVKDTSPFVKSDEGCAMWLKPGKTDGPHQTQGEELKLIKWDSEGSCNVGKADGSNTWWLNSSIMQRWNPLL